MGIFKAAQEVVLNLADPLHSRRSARRARFFLVARSLAPEGNEAQNAGIAASARTSSKTRAPAVAEAARLAPAAAAAARRRGCGPNSADEEQQATATSHARTHARTSPACHPTEVHLRSMMMMMN